MKQCEIISQPNKDKLQTEINEFCKYHNVISVSYSLNTIGVIFVHVACIIYDIEEIV